MNEWAGVILRLVVGAIGMAHLILSIIFNVVTGWAVFNGIGGTLLFVSGANDLWYFITDGR